MGAIRCAVAAPAGFPLTEENLSRSADCGIERVEIGFSRRSFDHRDRRLIESTAGLLAKSGVECRSVHLEFEPDYDISHEDASIRRRTLDDMAVALGAARVLGAEIAVVHGSDEPVEPERRARRIALLKGALDELAAAARREGVKLALELLPRECLANTISEASEILADLDARHVGICFDVNHVNLREDPGEAVRAVAERILSFHVSDNDGVEERHWFPFEGVIDWAGFMSAVRAVGYAGQFVFETGGSLGEDLAAYLCEVRARFDRLMAL